MRRFLQKFPSLVARNFIHSPTNFRYLNTYPRRVVPFRAISRFVFFSSGSDPTRGQISDEVVSKEELKKRIQSFLDDGDEDAIPDLFEALMNRKLSGMHDESDDEVMVEVRKYPINHAHKVHVTDSDSESDDGLRDGDSSSDSDFESDNDDLSDGDSSSDSDFESDDDDLSDGGDSSDSDFESDDDDDLSDGDSSDSDSESD